MEVEKKRLTRDVKVALERRKDLLIRSLDEEKITRRQALGRGATIAIGAGVVIVGAAGYYAYVSTAGPTYTTTTPPTTTTAPPTTTTSPPSTTSAALTGPDHALVFAIGSYRPDMVKDNVGEFDKEYNPSGPASQLQQLSGDLIADYTTKLQAGGALDLIYSYPYSTVTFAKAGWIQPVDDIKAGDVITYNMSDIKPQLYKNWVDAFTVDGKFYGLPYYTSDVGLLLTNEKIIAKGGMTDSDYPTTWKEFYSQASTLKSKGFDEPVLHAWYNEPFGIPWQFLLETINQGGDAAMFDPNPPHAATFDTNTLAKDVLTAWKNAWDSGLAPHGILTMKQTDYLGAFATGKYFYQPNGDYFAGFMNDPSKSQIAGYCSFVPPKQQPWGLIDTAAIVLVNRKDRTQKDQQYAEAMLEFMGYKDKSGNFLVPKKWAIQESLQSGYPAVVGDPEVVAGFQKRLMRISDLQVIRSHLETAKVPSGWKAPWYAKWNTQAQTELPQIFTGGKSITDVISDLRKFADSQVQSSG